MGVLSVGDKTPPQPRQPDMARSGSGGLSSEELQPEEAQLLGGGVLPRGVRGGPFWFLYFFD